MSKFDGLLSHLFAGIVPSINSIFEVIKVNGASIKSPEIEIEFPLNNGPESSNLMMFEPLYMNGWVTF